MVVVDDLDERLDLAALGLAGLGHAAGDVQRVALDAGDDGVGEGVDFAAVVDGHEEDDLLAGVAAAGDDGLWLLVFLRFFRVSHAGFVRTTRPTLRTARILAGRLIDAHGIHTLHCACRVPCVAAG